jgi:TonB family protein
MTAEQRFREDYPRILRAAVLGALVLHVVAFLVVPGIRVRPYRIESESAFEVVSVRDWEIPAPPEELPSQPPPTAVEPTDGASEDATTPVNVLPFEDFIRPLPVRAVKSTGPRTSWEVPPKLVRQVLPDYPELARLAELEGTVMLRIVIDESGDVVDARAVQSVPGLDEAAIEAVLQWKYEPALQSGIPVPIVYHVPVRFELRG